MLHVAPPLQRIRVRAAPYVDTLRREGIHTLKDLVGVSVMVSEWGRDE